MNSISLTQIKNDKVICSGVIDANPQTLTRDLVNMNERIDAVVIVYRIGVSIGTRIVGFPLSDDQITAVVNSVANFTKIGE